MAKITKTIGHKVNDAGNVEPIKKQFYGKTKKEATQKYEQWLIEHKSGREYKNQYFGVMANSWINDFLANDNSLKNSTRALYIGTWNNYMKDTEVYGMKLNEVTAGTLQRLYNNLDCPTKALEVIRKVMVKFYKYLVVEGYVPHDVTGSLSIRKAEKKTNENITIWSEEELKKILQFENTVRGFRLRFLIILAIYTGCRIGELLGLKYEDIQENKDGSYELNIKRQVAENIVYRKGQKQNEGLQIATLKSSAAERTIPLHSYVIEELRKHEIWQKKDMMKNGYRTDYIFTTSTGKFYDKGNVRDACKSYYKRIGVEHKKFHTYRHTFGTMTANNGVPIQTVSALMGHSDINITAKYYISVSPKEKEKAINIVDKVLRGNDKAV